MMPNPCNSSQTTFKTPVSTPITVPSLPPKAPSTFPGKCFNYQQQGHHNQDCPNRKIILLAEESPEDEDLEAQLSGCAFEDLEYYPEVHVDMKFNCREDCYEVPLPDSNF